MKKYDVTTSHCFTQHWDIKANNKDEAAKKVMEGGIKFDKTSRTYVSSKLTRTYMTIPDAKILAIEPIVPENSGSNWDTLSYEEAEKYVGGTDPD